MSEKRTSGQGAQVLAHQISRRVFLHFRWAFFICCTAMERKEGKYRRKKGRKEERKKGRKEERKVEDEDKDKGCGGRGGRERGERRR